MEDAPLLDFGKVFTEIAHGDEFAFAFCSAFYRFTDLVDDQIDGDKPPRGVEELAAINLSAAMAFAINPFFHRHREEFMQAIREGVKAYADSLVWTSSEDPNFRQAATVLATKYQEVFWLAAKFTGGQSHYDSIIEKYRHYRLEEPAPLPLPDPSLPVVQWSDFDDSIFDFVCLKPDGTVEKDAKDFCSVVVRWLHSIDDSLDKDKQWSPQDLVRVNMEAISTFAENEFFQTNRLILLPLLIQGFRAWADSARWEKSEDIQEQRAAQVFKSLYTETIFHVAFLVNGWDHLAAVTEKLRKVDNDLKE